MEISAIKGGDSHAEWQKPLKISLFFWEYFPLNRESMSEK